jgi:transcriptional regulator with XRE-family HTH domain
MSKLSELLKAADERHHMTLRDRQTKAGSGIQFGTIGKYLRGIHPDHPDEETLEALSRAFDLPLAKVQEAAGVPVGAGPWEPPPEVTRLSKRQQKALTELIRSMAEESSDGRQPDAEKSDDDEGRLDVVHHERPVEVDRPVSWQERRRQRMIDQAQNVEEAADDHPRQADYEVADEDVSQDPDDWGQD